MITKPSRHLWADICRMHIAAQRERDDIAQLVSDLEYAFEDRGLRFTINFIGALPQQAYGHLDGLRFYFRFRGNHASLTLGAFDKDFEEKYEARCKAQYEDNHKNDDPNDKWALKYYDKAQHEDDPRFYPRIVLKHSYSEGPNPGNTYAGWLPPKDLGPLFIKLATSLEDVPTDYPRNARTLRWVETGDTSF
jgi:hypothetical protein